MLWDFGLPKTQFDNVTAVSAKIDEMRSLLDLVLVAERFDESMVLLKHELCWDYEDVTYLKLNAMKAGAKSTVSHRAREELKKWLASDYKVYDTFLADFDRKVEAFGRERMEQELAKLRAANADVASKCGLVARDNDELTGERKLWGKNMIGYDNVRDEGDCKLYSMAEMSFIDHLREVQTTRAKAKLRAQGKEYEGCDPGRFKLEKRKDGRPDLEALKKRFGHAP